MPIRSTDPAQSLALITPSFGPDLARCELLVESARRLGPGLRHYLLVDRRDRARFAHLESPSTRIVHSEDLLPRFMRRFPTDRSIWASPIHRPVRGWIVQQVLKLAIAREVDEDMLAYCDSDTCFIRPFAVKDFLVSGELGLLDVGFRNDEVDRWTAIACDLLGLDPHRVPVRGHVGNMICWRRENVVGMLEVIQQRAGRDWRRVLLRLPTLSEYVLYGVYVRALIGYPESKQRPSTVPLVKGSWGEDLSDTRAIERFFRHLDPRTIAVMIHSKDCIEVSQYRHHVESLWESAR